MYKEHVERRRLWLLFLKVFKDSDLQIYEEVIKDKLWLIKNKWKKCIDNVENEIYNNSYKVNMITKKNKIVFIKKDWGTGPVTSGNLDYISF